MKTRALLVCLAAAILTLGAAAAQTPRTLDRDRDPVVMTGADIPSLEGSGPDAIVAFRYEGQWEQIPIQVDERALIDWGQVYNQAPIGRTVAAYTDPGTYAGADPDPGLDADDEVVFMARDTGDQVDGSAGEPGGVVAGTGLELEVEDPLTGDRGWVYVFLNGGTLAQDAGKDYVTYDFNLLSGSYIPTYDTQSGPNPEDSAVTTAAYGTHFSDRWIRDEVRVFAGGATGVDILDRHKSLFAPGVCARSEETFSNGEGGFFVNKDGAVRALRSYFGANSGPTTERLHIFYPERQDIRVILRVHAISGVVTFYDYSPEASGMVYRNDQNPAGVVIDGVPDIVSPALQSWDMVTGAQGTLVLVQQLLTDIATLAPVAYYSDDNTPDTTQCTGDAYEYGASGIWIDDPIPNTDPNIPGDLYHLEALLTVYYEAPDQDASLAAERDRQARNPLVLAAVRPWPGTAPCDPSRISPIGAVLTTRSGSDVVLGWVEDPNAQGYNVWYVGERELIPQARLGGLGSLVSGCAETIDPLCTDVGAAEPSLGTLRYYQVRGTCPGEEAQE